MQKLQISAPLGFLFLALSFFPHLACYSILTTEEHLWSTDYSAYDLLAYEKLCAKSQSTRKAFQKTVYFFIIIEECYSEWSEEV